MDGLMLIPLVCLVVWLILQQGRIKVLEARMSDLKSLVIRALRPSGDEWKDEWKDEEEDEE